MHQLNISQQTPTTDRTYTANAVNEYTQTDAPETFSHDDDGTPSLFRSELCVPRR